MSWFGDSLSSFTGQLSNFTKEVLSEGREEINDGFTELSSANERIKFLENLCSSQKHEIENFKLILHEKEEHCHAAELQINKISSQYRDVVQQKEEEIKYLKQQLMEYQETSYSVRNSSTFRDEHDHDYTLLSEDLDSLEFGQDHISTLSNNEPKTEQESLNLVSKNEDINKQLQLLTDQHQQQLATLQDHYSQLAREQQRETSRLKERLKFYDNLSNSSAENADSEVVILRKCLADTEKQLLHCQMEIENLVCQQTEKDRAMELMSRQLKKLQEKTQGSLKCQSIKREATNSFDSTPNKDLTELEYDIELKTIPEQLNEESVPKKEEVELLIEEKNFLNQEVKDLSLLNEELKQKCSELENQIKHNDSNGMKNTDENRKLLLQTINELDNVKKEKNDLEKSLIELDEQHEETMNAVLLIKDRLSKSNNDLKDEVKDLKYKLQENENESAALNSEIERFQNQVIEKIFSHKNESNITSDETSEILTQKPIYNFELSENRSQNLKLILKAIESIKNNNNALAKKMSCLEGKKIEIEASLVSIKQEKHEVAANIKLLESENDHLNRKVENISLENKELQDRVDKLEEVNEKKTKQDNFGHPLTKNELSELVNTYKYEILNVLGMKSMNNQVNLSKNSSDFDYALSTDISLLSNSVSVKHEINEKYKPSLNPTLNANSAEHTDIVIKNDSFKQFLNNDNSSNAHSCDKNIQNNIETVKNSCPLKSNSPYDVPTLYSLCKTLTDSMQDLNNDMKNINLIGIKKTDEIWKMNEQEKKLINADCNLNSETNKLKVYSKELENELEIKKEELNKQEIMLKTLQEEIQHLKHQPKTFANNEDRSFLNIHFSENNFLPTTINNKESDILQLNSHLESLTKQGSISSNIGTCYVDKHTAVLEKKIQNLELEKEQMLSVLNEKSQECSNLKSEVHRLINTVSAEKQALMKLQQENQSLIKHRETLDENLTKEALQNLSHMIRDKEIEIEALGQKNKTLLAVIQQSTSHDSVESLLKDQENLLKQLGLLNAEREHMIGSLSQKQKECLQYHSEVERLNELLMCESEKYDTLQQQHQTISQQYEEKQKSLINTQNELISLKQRVSELENQHTDLRLNYNQMLDKINSDTLVYIKKEELHFKLKEIEDLKETIAEKEKWIIEKNCMIHDLSQTCHKQKEEIDHKTKEISSLKKRLDDSASMLTDIRSDFSHYKTEVESSKLNHANTLSEMSLIKELNERMTMSLQEKEFEMNMMKEKVATLSSIVQENPNSLSSSSGDVENLLAKNNSMEQQVQLYHQERDEAVLALNQTKQENKELNNEMKELREKVARLTSELERLRHHLLQIEDSYTKEAILAEEREKELRNRLVQLEEKAKSSSCAVENSSHIAMKQVESLQEQLGIIVSQRDKSLAQVSELEDQVQQYAASLANLQLVLEQFQREKERDIQNTKRALEKDLQEERMKVKLFEEEVHKREFQLSETSEALDAATRLSEQLDFKEDIISSLKLEVATKEKSIAKVQDQIRKIKDSTEGKVDKQIMKSLVLGYFTTPDNQKVEVVRLLARVLDFSQDEMNKAGMKVVQIHKIESTGGGFFSGIFSRISFRHPHEQTRSASSNDQSLSALFVKFLEQESQPAPHVLLPAEEMAREMTKSVGQNRSRTNHINPFNFTPGHNSKAQPKDQLLMKPISASFPTFTPLPVDRIDGKSNEILKEILK